jgi:hypothetical protein
MRSLRQEARKPSSVQGGALLWPNRIGKGDVPLSEAALLGVLAEEIGLLVIPILARPEQVIRPLHGGSQGGHQALGEQKDRLAAESPSVKSSTLSWSPKLIFN